MKKKVSFNPKPFVKGKKEHYQQLNLIGTPQHSVEVDDSVFLSENKLLGTYMEPNFKRQPYVPQDHEYTSKLNLFTGRNLKPLLDRPEKKENPPLFAPFKYDYLTNKNDVMNKTLAMASRYRDETSNISRKFEKPAPTIRVAPGVDIGYNAEPTDRPFHPWYRTPEFTIDELRGEVRPSYKIERTEIGLKGDKSHFMPKPKNLKRRPEDIYGQGNQARIVPGLGTFTKGANARLAKKITRRGKKVEPDEHFGPEYRVNEYRELPEDRKPYIEPVRLYNRPDDSKRNGNPYNTSYENTRYDKSKDIKLKLPKKMQYIRCENTGNVKALIYKSVSNETRGKNVGHDVFNKELGLRASRHGILDNDTKGQRYTNKRTLLTKMPQEYDDDRDLAPDNTEKEGNILRNVNGILIPENHAYSYVDAKRTGMATKENGKRILDKKTYKFMKDPKTRNINDILGIGNSSNKRQQNRKSNVHLKKDRPTNAYVNKQRASNRYAVEFVQSAYKLSKPKLKKTNREDFAGTERFGGGGSNMGYDYRDNTTTNLNTKRPVTVNRRPNGVSVMGTNYSAWDNQYMGLTRTNVNRSAATQQPIPYPKVPTMNQYGYNNKIIMGANTRDTRKKNILSQVDYRPTSLIKPFATFK